jgi:periplasmic protein TonB
MFQDALMESSGRLRTKHKSLSLISVVLNILVLLALLVWPLIHPLALPNQAMTMLMIAPVPPAPAAPIVKVALTRTSPLIATQTLDAQLIAPSKIPKTISTVADAAPSDGPTSLNTSIPGSHGDQQFSDLFNGTAAPSRPVVKPAVQKPVAISSGVMAGNKISGVEPIYPAIAKMARIQGTVVLAATISKTGSIENLRLLSGPPMLVDCAIEAVKSWRYRPYRLNGEPVEVETTINIVFNLNQP